MNLANIFKRKQKANRIVALWDQPLDPKTAENLKRQTSILGEVVAERDNQDAKYGVQNYNPFVFLSILTEEVGEVSKAINDLSFGNGHVSDLREELIQVAAVAVQFLEAIDRQGDFEVKRTALNATEER